MINQKPRANENDEDGLRFFRLQAFAPEFRAKLKANNHLYFAEGKHEQTCAFNYHLGSFVHESPIQSFNT